MSRHYDNLLDQMANEHMERNCAVLKEACHEALVHGGAAMWLESDGTMHLIRRDQLVTSDLSRAQTEEAETLTGYGAQGRNRTTDTVIFSHIKEDT